MPHFRAAAISWLELPLLYACHHESYQYSMQRLAGAMSGKASMSNCLRQCLQTAS